MLTVCKTLDQLRAHFASPSGDLLRIVLNAASPAEANLALSILQDSIDERTLVKALNLREAFKELPSAPFATAIDMESLARAARLMKRTGALYREFEGGRRRLEIAITGDGNLCYDMMLAGRDGCIYIKQQDETENLIDPEALELFFRREGLMTAVVDLVTEMGAVFSPRFYLSLYDWRMEYAGTAMDDLSSLF